MIINAFLIEIIEFNITNRINIDIKLTFRE